MKKRGLALIMAAVLLLCVPAMAEDVGFVLSDKLVRQVDAGSGFSGTLVMSGPKDVDAWSLFGYSGTEKVSLDFRYITPFNGDTMQSRITLSKGDAQLMTAFVQQKAEKTILDTDLLPGQLIGLDESALNMLLDIIVSDEGSSLRALMESVSGLTQDRDEEWQTAFDTALEPYLTKVDFWLQGFAKEPETIDGLQSIVFEIPAPQVKAQMKQLVIDLLGDQALMTLLQEAMADDELSILLNPAFADFYTTAIDALPLSGSVVIERQFTAQGVLAKSSITLPMPEALYGGKSLTYTEAMIAGNSVQSFTLETVKGTLSYSPNQVVSSGDTTTYSGSISYIPVEVPNWEVDGLPKYESKILNCTFTAMITKVSMVDSEEKTNETFTADITLTPDWSHLEEGATLIPEVLAQHAIYEETKILLSYTFRSGQSRNQSVAISGLARWQGSGTAFKMELTGKTAAPWATEAVDEAKAVAYTADQWEAAIAQLRVNFLKLFAAEAPDGTVLPEIPAVIPPAATDAPPAATEPPVAPQVPETGSSGASDDMPEDYDPSEGNG